MAGVDEEIDVGTSVLVNSKHKAIVRYVGTCVVRVRCASALLNGSRMQGMYTYLPRVFTRQCMRTRGRRASLRVRRAGCAFALFVASCIVAHSLVMISESFAHPYGR